MEVVESIGKFLELPKYDDIFIRFSKVNKSKKLNEQIFKIIDGKEVGIDFSIFINHNNHKVKINNVLSIDEVCNAKVNLLEVCRRADVHNKSVIGYVGKNAKYEKIYLIKCNKCGYVAEQFMRKFFYCNGCNPSGAKPFENFVIDAKKVHKDRYDYSDVVYVNSFTKIKILCLKCDRYFFQSPHAHLRGHGCSHCKESKGELKMIEYFESKGIVFERQKSYSDLFDKKPLKYDFYLPDYNCLMEYDGIGHYVAKFGSTPERKQFNLLDTQKKDEMKNSYAEKNNIELLRIPYWDKEKIFEILDLFFVDKVKIQEKELVCN